MLPPELRTPRLSAASNELIGDPNYFSRTAPLGDRDILTIGRFVQMYNYIEFNLRRSVELFARSGHLPSKDKGKSIHEVSAARLIPLVKQGVTPIASEASTLVETLAKLDEIEFRRPYRNMFAHFAARTFNEDLILFITRSDFDARQALNAPLGEDGVMYAIMERSDIESLLQHLMPYEEWIARKALTWRLSLGFP